MWDVACKIQFFLQRLLQARAVIGLPSGSCATCGVVLAKGGFAWRGKSRRGKRLAQAAAVISVEEEKEEEETEEELPVASLKPGCQWENLETFFVATVLYCTVFRCPSVREQIGETKQKP